MHRRDVIKIFGGAALSAAIFPTSLRAAPNRVSALYEKAIVIDGNLIADMLNDDANVDAATAARIRASGLTVMKQSLGGAGDGYADTVADMDHLDRAIAKNAGLFMQIVELKDIAEAKKTRRVGLIYSFESANMHEGRIDRIGEFRHRGVRVMGLSYNPGSAFGSGTLSKSGLGLTALGHDAVREMNSQGVTVDLSHSDEPTSLQTIAASRRPVIVTHAGCAAVHRHPRNKSDGLLRAVAEKGGVIGIYDLSYLGDYPANPSLGTYMRHLTHALDICGEDHVGIGSDTGLLAPDLSPAGVAAWDRGEAERKAQGVAAPEEGPLPYVRGLESETRWQVIAAELSRRGYSFRVIEKVLGLNFERAFSETW